MLAARCLACDTGCKGRTFKDRTRWHPIMPFNRHTQKECGRTGRHNRRAGTAYIMSFSFTHFFSISCSLSSCANGTSNLPSTISVLISSLSQHQHSSLISFGLYLIFQWTDKFKQNSKSMKSRATQMEKCWVAIQECVKSWKTELQLRSVTADVKHKEIALSVQKPSLFMHIILSKMLFQGLYTVDITVLHLYIPPCP